ncbi:hypothetical protein T484DRAFT_1616996 [Baffinella frigidus]|nr:hypothetical protein T484DRAFT_1616996 [Cryptophyta sp. CCMP2293]
MHGAELRGEEEQVAAQRSPSPEPEDLQEDADEETKKFAEYLGMNGDDRHLMWIAESAVRAPLPSGWTQHAMDDGSLYFHQTMTNESSWEHPTDGFSQTPKP